MMTGWVKTFRICAIRYMYLTMSNIHIYEHHTFSIAIWMNSGLCFLIWLILGRATCPDRQHNTNESNTLSLSFIVYEMLPDTVCRSTVCTVLINRRWHFPNLGQSCLHYLVHIYFQVFFDWDCMKNYHNSEWVSSLLLHFNLIWK